MYIGHKREDGAIQPLEQHLQGVAQRAAAFAAVFGGEAHGYRTGLLHDIGKYAAAVQRRLDDPENVDKVDHSTAGAQAAAALRDSFAAFAIAGHHGGLMNPGSPKASVPSDGTLWGRLKKPLSEDISAYQTAITVNKTVSLPPWLSPHDAYALSFYTRMLFSCLVDADFLDTEAFMQGDQPRGDDVRMETLLEKLRNYVSPWWNPTRELNRKRCEILSQCLDGGRQPRGLYTLTVPTGGGKTGSSLAFALSHAVAHGLRRVIYIVPYTSIIEQNAQVFADILGAEHVLEHHSGVEYEDDATDAAALSAMRKRLATENWDAPVIVTTAVQFFESLYAARTSSCRKLHNIADSVLVFDEAQMLPLNFLRPCVAAITELVRHYGATAVLCTATQPALNGLIAECAPMLPVREICPDTQDLYPFFRRVHFRWEGTLADDTVAERLAAFPQVLCIVNSRKRAQAVFERLPEEGRFHLSTLMTPDHRRAVLETVRARLKEGLPCHVVSTSLIEAGVDVDFPAVWREEAGLDSILQAAGRCNREGRRVAADSPVYVFAAEDGAPPLFRQQVAAMHAAVADSDEPDSPAAIRTYFEKLLVMCGDSVDYKCIMQNCVTQEFKTVAHDFRLIDNDTETVYVPSPKNAALLDRLGAGFPTKKLLRQLAHSAVNIYHQHYAALQKTGKLELTEGGFAILADVSLYDAQKGLSLVYDAGAALFA